MWRGLVRELTAVAGALAVVLGVGMAGRAATSGHDGDSSVPRPSEDAQASPRTPGRDIPDLAMIVAGDTGRTVVLRSPEPAFARLRELLRPTYEGTERVPASWNEDRYPPVDFTVIWGLTGVGGWPQTNRAPGDDVAVERQDQLFVAPDGTPWIRSDPAPDVQDDDIRWHRAPRSVFVRLEQERVLSGLGRAGRGDDGAADNAAAQGTARAESGRDRVRWAGPGLAVGIAVGAGGTVLIRRAAARRDAGPPREEPRQELIDL
ncbi:hypothetical protein [Streptomyces griseorubiginosus]|uniref:hypothetical protein n=1 Tax=Streptomyces griseorubiginosus TaxID=67304 RepID=UPI003F76E325